MFVFDDLSDDQRNLNYLLKCKIDTVVNFEGISFYHTRYENFFPDTVYKDHHAVVHHPIVGWYNKSNWIGVDSSNTKVYYYYAKATNPYKRTLYNLAMKLNEAMAIDISYEFGYYSVRGVGIQNIVDHNRI